MLCKYDIHRIAHRLAHDAAGVEVGTNPREHCVTRLGRRIVLVAKQSAVIHVVLIKVQTPGPTSRASTTAWLSGAAETGSRHRLRQYYHFESIAWRHAPTALTRARR